MYIKVIVLYISLSATSILGQNSDETRDRRIPFKTYWNMPTFQCARYKLGFEELAKKYNIIQNQDDKFIGEHISLLYNPGWFSAILDNNELRNGGVPQEGDFKKHLEIFKTNITQKIPDANFAGIGIIDFEDWRPVYLQNFGVLQIYKQLSEKIEKMRHPLWSNDLIQKEAKRRFEKHGRLFMEQALLLAQQLRPNAQWGYYGFPHCFNHNMQDECPSNVQSQNDDTKWLFETSTTLNPSIYLRQGDYTETERKQLIKGRVKEAIRVRNLIKDGKQRTVTPYYTLIYPDTNKFLSEGDIMNSISVLKDLQIDGLIIWGASSHVNTKEKCEALYKYIDTIFGPALNR